MLTAEQQERLRYLQWVLSDPDRGHFFTEGELEQMDAEWQALASQEAALIRY